MNPIVSVVIVNLDGKDLLKECLRHVSEQSFGEFEVIIVDNGSRDGSLEWLLSLDTANLTVVSLPENLGFAAGCNAGIERARGRYVATLNNDARPETHWLERLVAVAEDDPRIGMCASKILLDRDPGLIDKAGHEIYWDGLNHGRGCGERDTGRFDRTEETLFPDAAAALYRRSLLDSIGAFDEEFFAYGDDCDLGLRARRAGWKCMYVPEAKVRHIHSATAGPYSPFKVFHIERNRIWVLAKHYPLPLVIVSPFFTVVRLALHAYGVFFGVGLSGRFATTCGKAGLVAAMFRAYLSGLAGLPRIWRERRRLREASAMGGGEFVKMLWRHRATLRSLTIGD